MLKKETIEKIAKIENNPFIIHILNKQNINVKDLLMVMSLCGSKINAEKIKNLVLPEIDCIKELEKPKKVVINKPVVASEEIKTDEIKDEVIEPEIVEAETVEVVEVASEEIKTDEIKDEVIEPIEKVIEEESVKIAVEVTEEGTEKPKKKSGKKKKSASVEEVTEEEPKTEE